MASSLPASANQRSATGWLIALASTFCFSLATPIARAAVVLGVQPVLLLTLRLIVTTALLLGTLVLAAPSTLRISRRGFVICVIAGIANGMGTISYFSSLTYVNASVASMIFATSPIVVLLLLALRGERFTARNGVRVALGLAGVYLLIGPGGQVNALGAALAAASVISVPLQLVIIQWYLRDVDSRTVTVYTVATMMIITSAFWLATGGTYYDIGWQGWALVIALAVVATYVARILMVAAIQRVGGGQVGLLAPLETLLSVVWSFIFLGERLSPVQWAGSLLILVSASLAIQGLGRLPWRKPVTSPAGLDSIQKDNS